MISIDARNTYLIQDENRTKLNSYYYIISENNLEIESFISVYVFIKMNVYVNSNTIRFIVMKF